MVLTHPFLISECLCFPPWAQGSVGSFRRPGYFFFSISFSLCLSQKERDLELAARIGQSLLKKNKTLTERNELLEEQVEHIREEVRSWAEGATVVVRDVGPGPIRKGPLQGSSVPSPGLPVLEWPPGHNTWPSCSSRSLCLLLTMGGHRGGHRRGNRPH